MPRILISEGTRIGRVFAWMFPQLVIHIVWSTGGCWNVRQLGSEDNFNMWLYFGSIEKGDGSGDSGYMFLIWRIRIVFGWAAEE